MSSAQRTIPDLIDALGGPSGVGRIIGKGQSTVSEMKRSGKIKVRYWPAIIAAAREAGLDWVTSESLMRMHAAETAPEAAE